MAAYAILLEQSELFCMGYKGILAIQKLGIQCTKTSFFRCSSGTSRKRGKEATAAPRLREKCTRKLAEQRLAEKQCKGKDE